MANYNGKSHYTHEIDQKYLEGWDRIFNKKQKKENKDEESNNSDVLPSSEQPSG